MRLIYIFIDYFTPPKNHYLIYQLTPTSFEAHFSLKKYTLDMFPKVHIKGIFFETSGIQSQCSLKRQDRCHENRPFKETYQPTSSIYGSLLIILPRLDPSTSLSKTFNPTF